MYTKKEKPSRRIFQIFNYILLIGFTLICVYPFWTMIIYTVSDPSVADIKAPILFPKGFTLNNYKEILVLNGFFHSLLISILRTVLGTFVTVFASAIMGYLFTKEEMPCRKVLYRAVVLTMYINGGLIPTFILIRSYGLLNNFWVYILPMTVSGYYIILIKTFVEQLPKELEEAAVIDGAGYFKVFTSVIIPLSKPIIATIAVFAAVSHWNSWFDNYIYTSKNEGIQTLQYLLYQYLNQAQQMADQVKNSHGTISSAAASISTKGVRMTITVLAFLPIFIVYPFMQRFFTKGIMLGAVKC